jgi:hypothetical protein
MKLVCVTVIGVWVELLLLESWLGLLVWLVTGGVLLLVVGHGGKIV